MDLLIALIAAILRAILPAVAGAVGAAAAPTAEDAACRPELRGRLVERIRATWGTAAILAAACMLGGCGLFTRTVYVPHGEPVRLRRTSPAARIWAVDAAGKPVAGKMDLPEGWYCLPAPRASE